MPSSTEAPIGHFALIDHFAYERLVEPLPGQADHAAAVAAARHQGAFRLEAIVMPLDAPVDWDGEGLNRSERFRLHAWDPLEALFVAADAEGDPDLLKLVVRFVDEWIAWSDAGGACLAPDGQDMVWYDMGVGLRAYRLAWLISAVARHGLATSQPLSRWQAVMERHRDYLADDGNFAAHNNHGLYQAAGQIAAGRRLARLAGFGAMRAQGEARLGQLMRRQFSPEGVHLEHSPGYHAAVMVILAGLLDGGAIEDEAIVSTVREARDALGWMRAPDGSLVNFGDTDVIPQPGQEDARHRGEAPEQRAFLESGYWFVRASASGSLLAQTCAMHSRTHKHCDDASFVWHEDGLPLLIDAGRYGYLGRPEKSSELFAEGYWYADPKRVHVERSRAHNTIEVDGRNYPRRGMKPYGSGLVRTETASGVFASLARPLAYPGIRHQRVLAHRPGDWVLCIDVLRSLDGSRRDFRQWFNLAPGLTLECASPRELAFRDSRGRAGEARGLAVYDLAGASLSFYADGHAGEGTEGPGYPKLCGWHSLTQETFFPNPSFSFLRSGDAVWFASLLSLRPAAVLHDETGFDIAAGRGRFAWRSGEQETRLEIATADDGEPLLRFG